MNELINLGNGQYVKITMLKGEKGTNIATITKTGTSGLVDTYTVTLTDGSTTTFEVTNGKSIDHVEKTSTVGSVDTYTIYLTDGSSAGTFTVNNAIATVEENFSPTSTNPLMNKTLTNVVAGVENGSTASKTYYANDLILRNDSLYEVTTTVAVGTAWADGVNITEKTLGELISELNADLSGFSFRVNNNVPEYSIDGGTTWNKIGGGGMPSLNFSNPLHTFSSGNLSYTAVKDCYLFGCGGAGSYLTAYATINNVAKVCTFGYTDGSYNLPINVCVKLSAGDTVVSDNPSPNLHILEEV